MNTVGMISAIAAREREIAEVRAPVRLNRCSLYVGPPHKIDRPSTSRILPIEPVIDALTTLFRPFESAITAMINSAAFPNVAFNNPPAPSPLRGQHLGRTPHPSRRRNNADRGANKKRRGILRTWPEPQSDRDRQNQKEPSE